MDLKILKKALKELNELKDKQKVIVANLALLDHLKESIETRRNLLTLELEHYLNGMQIYFTKYIAKNSFSIMTRLEYSKFLKQTEEN